MAIKRRRVQVYTEPDKSLTEQHHARACDVNSIMAKYLKTGVIEHISKYQPQFGDVSEFDFQTSMETVARVEHEFHELPAYVRDHYKGDPRLYLAAVMTDEGLAELQALKPPGQRYNRDGSPEVTDSGDQTPQKPLQEPPKAADGDTEGVT